VTTIDVGPAPRVLLLRLSAIGDVVIATPVIRALRQAYPAAHLAWLVEEKAADIVRGNPELDEVIVWPRAAWGGEASSIAGRTRLLQRNAGFVTSLRQRRFDVAIDFQGLLRSALLARASGARWRIASEGSREGSHLFYNRRVARGEETSSRQRCLDLLSPLGIVSRDRQMHVWYSDDDARTAASILERCGGREGKVVCLCPATTWRHKHWREERWAPLADRLATELNLRPVFMGARADRPLIERIRAQMQVPSWSAAGETSLKHAAALLAQSELVIAVDTALMHIGVAVGTTTIGLCGPSYWPGFQDYDNFRMVRKPYACSPCLRHPTCQQDDCMTDIAVEDVFGEALPLFDRSRHALRVL
jgi:heptosyltransferase I